MHAKCFVCVSVAVCARVCTFNILYIKKKKDSYYSFISEWSAEWEMAVRQGNEMLPSGDILFMCHFTWKQSCQSAPPPDLHQPNPPALNWSPSPSWTLKGLSSTMWEPPPPSSARGSLDKRGSSRRWRQVKREFDGETAARVCEAWLKWFSDEQFIHHLGLKCRILRSVPPDSRWWGFITPANISRRFFDARQRARDDEEFSQFVPWWKVLTRW